MRKSVVKLLTLSIFVLCSCSNAKNQNAIHSYKTLEKEAVELTAKSVDYMIDNKYSFALLLYTSTCGLCESALENINKYVEDNSYSLYKIEMFDASINYLSIEHNEYFNSSLSYPLFYLFNKGQLTYKFESDSLTNYTVFSRVIRPQLIETNIYFITESSSYFSITNNNENCLLYGYDSSKENGKDIFYNYIYQRAIDTNKIVVLVDKNTAKDGLFSYYSSISAYSWSSLIITHYKQRKADVNYENASEEEINNLLNSFFNFNSIHGSR